MKNKNFFLDHKNTRIHYSDQGKGPTVVLLHGFLENISMWDDLAEVLSKRNRVVCIDLLGHGQSENLGYLHTMETNVRSGSICVKGFESSEINFGRAFHGRLCCTCFCRMFSQ